MHFGIPEEVTEIGYHFLIHPHPEGLEYVLVKSTIWVDVSRDGLVPHKYRSWYRHYHDGRREGLIPKGDVPLFVLDAAFGEKTADPKDGAVTDAKDPKLGDDPDSPEQSVVDSSWSMEKCEVVEEKEYLEENLEEEPEEDPEEESEEESEEDPKEDPEYDPDED
ncbi:hypothetical protein ACJRO7_029309 [Eucalyptus globulus]|uniref:Uncharacterized protein n=1 Tax=Eucalyptus globulus TaxID=34317 RepID=A0ABD3K7F8_EUCGL